MTNLNPISTVVIPTSEIISDNQKVNEESLKLLMKSIEAEGLINAITIRPDKKIIAGRHRLEAFKRLHIEKIPCCISTSKDPEVIRIHENTLRAKLPLERKLADAEYLITKYGNKVGRPAQHDENQNDKITDESQELSGDAEKIVVENGLFSNGRLYFNAKKVFKECITEVIDEIDSGALSIAFAYERIVRDGVKKDKQKSFLYKLGQMADAEIDKKLLNKDVHRRRAERRKKRFHIPTGPSADPTYNIIRIAPDWNDRMQDDIESLPVADYAVPAAVVAVECPAAFIGKAIAAIEAWGFTYMALVTAYDAKHDKNDTGHLHFVNAPSWHLVIGALNPDAIGARTTLVSPVHAARNPQAAMADILGEMWPDKKDSRIDMSSTVARKGWKVWKIDYAKKGE